MGRLTVSASDNFVRPSRVSEPMAESKVDELARWFMRPENWTGIRLTVEAQGDMDALNERHKIQVLARMQQLKGDG